MTIEKIRCKAQSSITGYPNKRKPCERYANEGEDYCSWHRHKPDTGEDLKESRILRDARRALLLQDSLAAVRIIAKGHNDPMALCQNVLKRFKDE